MTEVNILNEKKWCEVQNNILLGSLASAALSHIVYFFSPTLNPRDSLYESRLML